MGEGEAFPGAAAASVLDLVVEVKLREPEAGWFSLDEVAHVVLSNAQLAACRRDACTGHRSGVCR